jgi:hypothetical protein
MFVLASDFTLPTFLGQQLEAATARSLSSCLSVRLLESINALLLLLLPPDQRCSSPST